jgi:hypothetical protein
MRSAPGVLVIAALAAEASAFFPPPTATVLPRGLACDLPWWKFGATRVGMPTGCTAPCAAAVCWNVCGCLLLPCARLHVCMNFCTPRFLCAAIRACLQACIRHTSTPTDNYHSLTHTLRPTHKRSTKAKPSFIQQICCYHRHDC